MNGTWFKNKNDSYVICSCCGKKIIKGYIVGTRNLGIDCYESIKCAKARDMNEPSKILGIQQMHIDWINA
jgi:hypothetical protein